MINTGRIIAALQWLILLLLYAYDWFTYLPEESNFALLKSAYYVIILAAFMMVATLQIHQGKFTIPHLGTITYVVQAFVWLYLVRLYYDFMVSGVDQEIVTNPFAAVFLYVNAAIIPFYGFYFFRWDLIDLRKFNTVLLLIFLSMGMVSMYYIFTGKALEYLGADGRFMGNASMDTIAFGHLGTTITILALALFYQRGIHLWHKVLSVGAILAGLFISVAAGSRGAIVALIICFVAYLYMNGHKKKILIGIPVLAILLLAFLPYLNDILLSFDNQALERFYTSIYDPNSMDQGVTSGRDVLYEQAIENIQNHPILGSQLFINEKYVHNSILESFLGLGLIGGLIFIVLIGKVLITAIRMAEQDKRYLFISLLFIQYLSYSLFSRTLSMLPLFWLSIYIVVHLNAANHESVNNHPVL